MIIVAGTAARCHRGAKFLFDHGNVRDTARLVGALLLVLALLVLDENAADAEALVEFDRPHDALHVAVTVVAVGERTAGRLPQRCRGCHRPCRTHR